MYVLQPGNPERAGLDAKRVELIRRRAADWVASGKHQCIVILLARRGVICLHEAWGRLGPEPDAPPAQPDSIFWMASNTKPLTATAVLQLAEDGLLTINRRVRDVVPELCGAHTDELTIRHLLTHTSGWTWDGEMAHVDPRLGTMPSLHHTERYVRAGFDMPLSRRPGTEMNYSNYNYALLGEIVARVSGRPFWEFLHERVFAPLAMNDSFFRERTDAIPRSARLDPAHPFLENHVIDDRYERLLRDSYNGAYGLKSTAGDYARYVQMLMNVGSYDGARILHPRSVAEMTRNQIPGVGTNWFGQRYPEASWGLGIRVLTGDRWPFFDGSITPLGTFMHGGAGGTEWWADPQHDLLGVYCSVCLDVDYARTEMRLNFDLLQDMATAALLD
jgi:CubicO group peptidase (beta-lactamase class C family)